ncbi:MAG: tRNA lysidine(34) synthetase TilS [Muribaculaceae bacterium]|nr:tRNA lysidine(34) synthetase TilS [Muribaculaceae bacterium]
MMCKKTKSNPEATASSPTAADPDRLEHRVRACIAAEGITSVTAGISGGADSVAMLLMLRECGVGINAVHCNFHLRGDESERDRDFVEDLCRRLGIRLLVVDFDVKAYMEANRVSVEMACRELRYAEFRRIMRENGSDRIAVAHNADDNAETLLLNLMRGAGVAGLRGISPDNGEIIRPLLGVTRAEILEYLESKGETYVTDSTNMSSDYRRNFLRNEVIPLLETRWPGAKKSICHTASIMRQEERMLDWAEQLLSDADSRVLPFEAIRKCPDSKWIINRFISRFGGSPTQSGEIAASLEAVPFQSGKQWTVPQGRLVLERDRLEFSVPHDDLPSASCEAFDTDGNSLGLALRAPLSELWTSLPPDRIAFRKPETGDRIKPLGMSGSVTVSKVMKDARLSQTQKEDVMVALDTDTGEIIWIEGLKRSRLALVGPESDRCYRYRRTDTRIHAKEAEE